MSLHSCNNSMDIKKLSIACTKEFVDPSYECVKFVSKAVSYIRFGSGIWTIIVGILGIIGNLITLISIPYAASKNRHGLERNFFSATIFLLNWSLVDLLHCVVFLVPNGLQTLSEYPLWGDIGCKFNIVVGVSTMIADVGAFTFIAISRCLSINLGQKWTQFCETKLNIAVLIVLSWLPSIVVFLMQVFSETPKIEVGWNCAFGQCTYMNACQETIKNRIQVFDGDYDIGCRAASLKPHTVFSRNSLLWLLPMYAFPIFAIFITMISYAMIWNKVRQSRRHFHQSESNNVILSHRDIRMTWTILILIILNVICWLPYIIFPLALDFPIDDMDSNAMDEGRYVLYWILNNIFRSQYALNFFVYVFRSEQYRNAFYDFLGLFCGKKFERNENFYYQVEMRSKRLTR